MSAETRPDPPEEIDRSKLQVSAEHLRQIEIWKAMSEIVHRLRHTSIPTASNGALKEHIQGDPDGLLSPFFALWIADNYSLAGQYRHAIEAYVEVARRYPERRFYGQALGAIALEQAAESHLRLGEPEEAIAMLRDAAERFRGACYPGWIEFRIGQIAERAGSMDVAIAAYKKAADTIDPANGPTRTYRDLARRSAERLHSDRRWMRGSPEQLVAELTQALRDRNVEALRSLASPTHFTIGVMWSEGCFVDSGAIVELLAKDLGDSEPSCPVDCYNVTADKIYIPSDGWQGGFFSGPVFFVVTRAFGGFEWSGVALTRLPPSDPGVETFTRMRPKNDEAGPRLPGDPREPPEHLIPNGGGAGGTPPAMAITVADLNLKCPWPRGIPFYAGGIFRLGVQLAVFDAPILAAAAAAIPVFGPLISLAILGHAAAVAPYATYELMKNFPCGLGAGGLYYNQPTTHVGSSSFAIDFATVPPGPPPPGPSVSLAVALANLATLGQPVLSVAPGIVIPTLTTTDPRGSSTGSGNQVNVSLFSSKEQDVLFAAFVVALFTGVTPPVTVRFRSWNLHLDGPGLIPVSLGMFVRQGSRLGAMDDTGLSYIQHLHFEIIDNTTGVSVRPTPMDGQTLNDADEGRCMHSTNVPLP